MLKRVIIDPDNTGENILAYFGLAKQPNYNIKQIPLSCYKYLMRNRIMINIHYLPKFHPHDKYYGIINGHSHIHLGGTDGHRDLAGKHRDLVGKNTVSHVTIQSSNKECILAGRGCRMYTKYTHEYNRYDEIIYSPLPSLHNTIKYNKNIFDHFMQYCQNSSHYQRKISSSIAIANYLMHQFSPKNEDATDIKFVVINDKLTHNLTEDAGTNPYDIYYLDADNDDDNSSYFQYKSRNRNNSNT